MVCLPPDSWLKMFPDGHDRSARHKEKAALDAEVSWQIEVIAVHQRSTLLSGRNLRNFSTGLFVHQQ